MEECDVEVMLLVGLEATVEVSFIWMWGVDGASLSLSSSQETVSSGSRAAPADD